MTDREYSARLEKIERLAAQAAQAVTLAKQGIRGIRDIPKSASKGVVTVEPVFDEGYYIIEELKETKLWEESDLYARIAAQQSPELVKEALELMYLKGRRDALLSSLDSAQTKYEGYNLSVEDLCKRVAERTRRINLNGQWQSAPTGKLEK